ncbi:MAG: YggT family protein [Anaerolineae bacterium]
MDDRPYYPPPRPEGGRFILEDYERRNQLVRSTRLVWLVFGILDAMIGLRVLLKLIAANPEAGFAQFVYNTTEVFLAPFSGLTSTPSAGGAVLEIPSVIAILVYALLAWGIVKMIWIVFDKSPVA